MIRSKAYYKDRVIRQLQDGYPNIDFKISDREVFLLIDDVVNSMAKANYLENWQVYGDGIDEAFVTTWEGDNAIECIDPDGGDGQSYLILPATPAALLSHAGIREIWPLDYNYGPVRIMSHGDLRRTRRLMSGNLQGELGGYPQGNKFVFNQTEVRKNYSDKFGVRLVVKDSSALSENDPYPIPADMEEMVIDRVVLKLRERRIQPTDTVRDKVDAVNRT